MPSLIATSTVHFVTIHMDASRVVPPPRLAARDERQSILVGETRRIALRPPDQSRTVVCALPDRHANAGLSSSPPQPHPAAAARAMGGGPVTGWLARAREPAAFPRARGGGGGGGLRWDPSPPGSAASNGRSGGGAPGMPGLAD